MATLGNALWLSFFLKDGSEKNLQARKKQEM